MYAYQVPLTCMSPCNPYLMIPIHHVVELGKIIAIKDTSRDLQCATPTLTSQLGPATCNAMRDYGVLQVRMGFGGREKTMISIRLTMQLYSHSRASACMISRFQTLTITDPILLLDPELPADPDDGEHDPGDRPNVRHHPANTVCNLLLDRKDDRQHRRAHADTWDAPEPHEREQHATKPRTRVVPLPQHLTVDLLASPVHCDCVFCDAEGQRDPRAALRVAAHAPLHLPLPLHRDPVDDEEDAEDDVPQRHWHREDPRQRLVRNAAANQHARQHRVRRDQQPVQAVHAPEARTAVQRPVLILRRQVVPSILLAPALRRPIRLVGVMVAVRRHEEQVAAAEVLVAGDEAKDGGNDGEQRAVSDGCAEPKAVVDADRDEATFSEDEEPEDEDALFVMPCVVWEEGRVLGIFGEVGEGDRCMLLRRRGGGFGGDGAASLKLGVVGVHVRWRRRECRQRVSCSLFRERCACFFLCLCSVYACLTCLVLRCWSSRMICLRFLRLCSCR